MKVSKHVKKTLKYETYESYQKQQIKIKYTISR